MLESHGIVESGTKDLPKYDKDEEKGKSQPKWANRAHSKNKNISDVDRRIKTRRQV